MGRVFGEWAGWFRGILVDWGWVKSGRGGSGGHEWTGEGVGGRADAGRVLGARYWWAVVGSLLVGGGGRGGCGGGEVMGNGEGWGGR